MNIRWEYLRDVGICDPVELDVLQVVRCAIGQVVVSEIVQFGYTVHDANDLDVREFVGIEHHGGQRILFVR